MQSYSNINEGGIPLRNLVILSKETIGTKSLYSIRLTYHDGYGKDIKMVPEEILANFMNDLYKYGNNADVYVGCKEKDVNYNLPTTQPVKTAKSMMQLSLAPSKVAKLP
jgi:hypothetical protein